jgi:hypothetical protein
MVDYQGGRRLYQMGGRAMLLTEEVDMWRRGWKFAQSLSQ